MTIGLSCGNYINYTLLHSDGEYSAVLQLAVTITSKGLDIQAGIAVGNGAKHLTLTTLCCLRYSGAPQGIFFLGGILGSNLYIGLALEMASGRAIVRVETWRWNMELF